ncbi:hypothetical protein P154DRAFT_461254 [Amniculicola lignicola CBS 123094]|uniref:Uncharacterized protein n=1 Tax=Amniculicola lignicola CBS 123094 TaxID=1392246 RepID=A0A6A5WLW3_9PLEO|nr:hypothetical protein P154DRAFT_461254 [Amniculicola lignicola CBS 123094]
MFCLRSWIPILFFLLRTNASPIYLILFISATYFLNRPCVYCSLLLFILVVALFDFQTPWFEPPFSSETESSALDGSTPLRDMVLESAGVVLQVANQTVQTVVKGAVDGIREKSMGVVQGSGSEWVRGFWGKKEWRIGCLDVLVRI